MEPAKKDKCIKTSVALTSTNYETICRIADASGVPRSEVVNRAISQLDDLINGAEEMNAWTKLFRALLQRKAQTN